MVPGKQNSEAIKASLFSYYAFSASSSARRLMR